MKGVALRVPQNKKLSCVELLKDKGAGFEKKWRELTPLHCASRDGYEGIVRLLIERGADVNARGINGEIPLYTSVYGEEISVVGLLLENGADPKLTNEDGFAPLHMAAQENLPEIARLLIENGAPCGAKSVDGATPTDLAVKSGAREIVDLLKECDKEQ